MNNEENKVTENNVSTNVTEIETPVQSVENNNINVVPVENTKTSIISFSPLVKVLLLVLLFSICFYMFASHSSFFRDRIGEKQVETTTTKKVEEGPVTLDEYLEKIEVSKVNSSLQVFDSTYKIIDPEYLTRCVNDGDEVSFESNGIKYEYSCEVEEDGNYDGSRYVSILGTINDTFGLKLSNYLIDENYYKVSYLVNDYLVTYSSSPLDNITSIGYHGKNGNDGHIILLNRKDDIYISPYISNGYLYCIQFDDDNADRAANEYVFNIMKYDLTDFKTVKKLGSFVYEMK